MEAAWIGMLGTAIGGVIGVLGSLGPHLWQRQRNKESARAITRAYISGIIRMEEIRDHASWYKQQIQAVQSGAQPVLKILGAEEERDALQPTVIAQIGFLEAYIASDVTTFINMLDGLRVDLKAMTLGQIDHLSAAQKVRILSADLALWEDALSLARKLVGRLKVT
jgi:hypothetical protein